MNTHYVALVFHESNGEHHADFHTLQASNEDAAWEAVDRYLTEKGITTVVMSALEGFPTAEAMSMALEAAMQMLMAGAKPKRISLNVMVSSAAD